MDTAWSSKMLVSYHIITWHHNTEDHDLKTVYLQFEQKGVFKHIIL